MSELSWSSLASYLHPAVLKYAESRWKHPTEIQIKAIPHVYDGRNVVISAPTGSGKTEAAMLPLISRLKERNDSLVRAVYIAPLRALVNNVYERLTKVGLSVGIPVGIKTGEKKKLRGRIIITTPESLSSTIFGKRKDLLMNVEHVIIDEIHNLIYSDRGIYLSIVLEFLYELLGRRPQLIGLSATIPEQDKEFILKFIGNDPVFVSVKSSKKPRFLLSECLESSFNERALPKKIIKMANLDLSRYGWYEKLQPTLIFGNSRRFVEYLANLLEDYGEFGVVHSDVKKRYRESYIAKFEDFELSGLIATSALGEGVDLSAANGVIQVASPGHPVFLQQRIGRARHRPGKLPVAGIISLSSIDFLENLVLIGLTLEDISIGFIPAVDSFSAISKAIVNAVSSTIPGVASEDKLKEIISRAPLITSQEFVSKILEALKRDKIIINRGDRLSLAQRRWYNLYKLGKDEPSTAYIKRAIRHFYTVIPYQSKYEVIVADKRVKIGNLTPEFVSVRIRPLMTFQLAGKNLRVIRIDNYNLKIFVEEIKGKEKIIPFWFSPPIIRIKEISMKMLDPKFLQMTYNKNEIIYKEDNLNSLFKDLLQEVRIINEAKDRGIPIVVSDTDDYWAITVFGDIGEGGMRYAAYALSHIFTKRYGPWSQPDIIVSPISFTLKWKENRPDLRAFREITALIKEDNEDFVENVIGDYGRVEATLRQIMDGVARAAYRLENLYNLSWEWLKKRNYLGILDKEEGEKLLKKLKDQKFIVIDAHRVDGLLQGIFVIPEEKMGYKAYRETLKRKVLETLKEQENPIDLEQLATLIGYRKSVRVLYEILYDLYNENKISMVYSEKGWGLPAKLQIIIKNYGKTCQVPVILPGKILLKANEHDIKIDYPVEIEPDSIEILINAEVDIASQIEENISKYFEKEAQRIKKLLIQEIGKNMGLDPIENEPKIKLIVEIPPPKALMRKNFRKIDEISNPWAIIKKYNDDLTD